jgi:hypothetical protein
MKTIVIIVIIIGIGIYVNRHLDRSFFSVAPKLITVELPIPQALPTNNFQCDGREYCLQMTSCEEATYFLNNCPTVKMDGDYDGIPCERQLCG